MVPGLEHTLSRHLVTIHEPELEMNFGARYGAQKAELMLLT